MNISIPNFRHIPAHFHDKFFFFFPPLNINRDDMQKLKSRVAAKARRKNENDQFEELVQLNPWIRSNPPDKSTVIRLTTSFIGLMKILDSSSNVKQIGKSKYLKSHTFSYSHFACLTFIYSVSIDTK